MSKLHLALVAVLMLVAGPVLAGGDDILYQDYKQKYDQDQDFYDDIIGKSGGSQSQDDHYMHQVLGKEQQIFTDRGRYHSDKPLRRLNRHYHGGFTVLDSYFDIFWDTLAFQTKNKYSDGSALVTFLFRDAVAFPEPPPVSRTRDAIDIPALMEIAESRWHPTQPSDWALELRGYWALRDFSARHEELVKKWMGKFASISFNQWSHAYRRNTSSKIDTANAIINFIARRRLPAICLMPHTKETVLVYKVVKRNADGVTAFYYWRPTDHPDQVVANDRYGENVIFAIPYRDGNGRTYGVRFVEKVPFQNRRWNWTGGRFVDGDILVIDDMRRIYSEVKPMMNLGSFIAGFDPNSGADPGRSYGALGRFIGELFNQDKSEHERGYSAAVGLIDEAFNGSGNYRRRRRPWGELEYDYGSVDIYGPNDPYAQNQGQQQGQQHQQGSGYYDDDYKGGYDQGGYDQGGYHQQDRGWTENTGGYHQQDQGWNGNKGYDKPVWVMDEIPRTIDLSSIFSFPVFRSGTRRNDTRTTRPGWEPLPPVRHYPNGGGNNWPPVQNRDPRRNQDRHRHDQHQQQPTRPPCPSWDPRPDWTDRPGADREYRHDGTRGHYLYGKYVGQDHPAHRSGTHSKWVQLGAWYDDQGYNRFGYDEDGYDREGYNPWGYDRKGYDEEGYDPWGFDRRGKDDHGEGLYSGGDFRNLRNQFHSHPLKFFWKYEIHESTGVVRDRSTKRICFVPPQYRKNGWARDQWNPDRDQTPVDNRRWKMSDPHGHQVTYRNAQGQEINPWLPNAK